MEEKKKYNLTLNDTHMLINWGRLVIKENEF